LHFLLLEPIRSEAPRRSEAGGVGGGGTGGGQRRTPEEEGHLLHWEARVAGGDER